MQASAFYFNTSIPDAASPAKNNDYYYKLLLILTKFSHGIINSENHNNKNTIYNFSYIFQYFH